MGLPIQVSAGCLLRPGSAWRALRLIKSGRSVLVASDCHGTERRPPDLGPASRVLRSRAADAGERALSLSGELFAAALAGQEGNEDFSLRSVGDMTVIIPVGPAVRRFPGMISVNETGGFLWERLEREQTLRDLARALEAEYQVTYSDAEADAAAFLDQLRAAGALIETQTGDEGL